MRLNLTDDEAKCLKETIHGTVVQGHGTSALLNVLKGVLTKLDTGIVGQAERDEFRVGNVLCKRVRGADFKGYDRRNTSKTHFGWIITHEPTGQTKELPPDKNTGITKRAVEMFAAQFAKLCEIKAGRAG